jgi:hypothetical protein
MIVRGHCRPLVSKKNQPAFDPNFNLVPISRHLTMWLVHANAAKATSREQQSTASGLALVYTRSNSHQNTRAKAEPPAAVLIELSSSASTGGATAAAMRSHKAMLTVPFVDVWGALGDGGGPLGASARIA